MCMFYIYREALIQWYQLQIDLEIWECTMHILWTLYIEEENYKYQFNALMCSELYTQMMHFLV
jgi:hypothetical protein